MIDINPPMYIDASGRSPLDIAASIGNTLVVMMLLDKGFRIDECDIEGNTPLLLAVKNKCTAVTQHLIHAGCDVRKTLPNDQNLLQQLG